MKILKTEIIDVAVASSTPFQFRELESGKIHFASSVFPDLNSADIVHNNAIILQLGKDHYLLGYESNSCEGYAQYKSGRNSILRFYDNGNLAIYSFTNGKLGLSLLNFTPASNKLEFNSRLLISTKDLPTNYFVESDGDYTKIELLLITLKFANLSMIHPESIRQWKRKQLIPVKMTSAGYSYYSISQVSQAKALAAKRANSKEIYKTISDKIKQFEPGIILCLSYFKALVTDYNKTKVSTLQIILRRMVLEGKLERFIIRGYYRIPK